MEVGKQNFAVWMSSEEGVKIYNSQYEILHDGIMLMFTLCQSARVE